MAAFSLSRQHETENADPGQNSVKSFENVHQRSPYMFVCSGNVSGILVKIVTDHSKHTTGK
jgi:hypothetical protein